jgi:hypothetical protein
MHVLRLPKLPVKISRRFSMRSPLFAGPKASSASSSGLGKRISITVNSGSMIPLSHNFATIEEYDTLVSQRFPLFASATKCRSRICYVVNTTGSMQWNRNTTTNADARLGG